MTLTPRERIKRIRRDLQDDSVNPRHAIDGLAEIVATLLPVDEAALTSSEFITFPVKQCANSGEDHGGHLWSHWAEPQGTVWCAGRGLS